MEGIWRVEEGEIKVLKNTKTTIIANDSLQEALFELNGYEFKVFIYCLMRFQHVAPFQDHYLPTVSFDKLAQMLCCPISEIEEIFRSLEKKGYIRQWDFLVGWRNKYDVYINYEDESRAAELEEYDIDRRISETPPILSDYSFDLIRIHAKELTGTRPAIKVDQARWEKLKKQVLSLYPRCRICKWDKKLDLHHRHYDTFNFESPEDVLLICRRCHKLIHRIALEYKGESGRV